MSEGGAKKIGLGIAIGLIAIAAAWLEINDKNAAGLWALVVLVVLFF